MMSKDKALIALKDIQNEYIKMLVIITEKSLPVVCKEVDDEKSFKDLNDFITQPTLDDCIAVVEEYAERYNDLHDVVLLTEVLLALKRLKEVSK